MGAPYGLRKYRNSALLSWVCAPAIQTRLLVLVIFVCFMSTAYISCILRAAVIS